VCDSYKSYPVIAMVDEHHDYTSLLYVYFSVVCLKYNPVVRVSSISKSGSSDLFTPSVILTWSKFKMKICFLLSYMFFLQFFTFVSEMLLGKSWLTIFYPSTFLDSGTPRRSSYC